MSITTPSPQRRAHAVQRIVVVGAGYVGLVTAACLAAMGHLVECVDADRDRVHRLRGGTLPFKEPGLDELVDEATATGTLRFGTDLAAAAERADLVFIAVGTLDGTGRWTDAHVSA